MGFKTSLLGDHRRAANPEVIRCPKLCLEPFSWHPLLEKQNLQKRPLPLSGMAAPRLQTEGRGKRIT